MENLFLFVIQTFIKFNFCNFHKATKIYIYLMNCDKKKENYSQSF